MNESILWKRGVIPKVIGVIHRLLVRNEKGLSKEKRRFFSEFVNKRSELIQSCTMRLICYTNLDLIRSRTYTYNTDLFRKSS